MATATGGKLILALITLFLGNVLIKSILKILKKSKLLDKAEGTVRTFTLSFVKISLYVLLVISVIGIMGVPMASVVTVLASASVAVGLALQGALSNLAGGIMLMIFKPFQLGDYVAAAGVEGVVKEVTLFYTVILTLDNKRITVPNGSLMNTNITDFSSEELRRVDLSFACAKSESPARIQELMLEAMKANPQVLSDPEPFARISGSSNEAMEFTVRAWCKSEDYWSVYFDLTQKITEAMGEHHVQAPAVRVMTETH
ncbi:MAG: mechanosensitive ion channel family protein [Eubacteriales bacterium]|nr:mechanosensitive ion channel family protein [Eubacteriales bacterium]